jgi:hypothetical protein
MARRRKPETFECPHCGADVRVGAAACRECGSDAETGWSESAAGWQAGGYADEDFDYDEFVAQEFPSEAERKPWAAAKKMAVALIVGLIILALLQPYLWP